MASKFLDPGSIFQIEVSSGLEFRLKIVNISLPSRSRLRRPLIKWRNVRMFWRNSNLASKHTRPSSRHTSLETRSLKVGIFRFGLFLSRPPLLSSVIITKLNNRISQIFFVNNFWIFTLRRFSFLHNFSRNYLGKPSLSPFSNVFIKISIWH